MFTVASAIERGGHCSRILSLRLHRYSHPSAHSSSPVASRHASTKNWVGNGSSEPTADENDYVISSGEIEFIQGLSRQFNQNLTPKSTIRDYGPSSAGPWNGSQRPHEAIQEPQDPPALPRIWKAVIEDMQRQDTQGLVHHMVQSITTKHHILEQVLAVLPRTTVTELFRSLDPFRVAKQCDTTDQMHIPVGMYTMLDMDNTIDEWGVRKLYTRLLPVLLKLMVALQRLGRTMMTEEYTYLFRYAGAMSDPDITRMIWNSMIKEGTTQWRNSDTYTEFASARFLTHPMYTGYDKTRRVVLPRNLHGAGYLFSSHKRMQLDRLRFNLRLRKYRFGLNRNKEYAEDLMRKLRHKGAARRIFQKTIRDNHMLTESLLCTYMIALGRAGALRLISSKILHNYFGIDMPLGHARERKIQVKQVASINRLPIRIRPTVQLMRAVVEVYGSNGEIPMAFQLLDHISDVYHIPIPFDVWNDLLQWAYILSAPPVSTAWAKVGWHWKIPSAAAVQMIWDTMTAAPYNIKPRFDQYNILIRSLLGRGLTTKALPLMREAIKQYDAQCRESERATLEHIQWLRDGASTISFPPSTLRHERARVIKHRMWYHIHTWCRKLLLSRHRARPHANDHLPDPPVPDLIREFRPFLLNPVCYLTPSGYVQLIDPTLETMRFSDGRHLVVNVPIKYGRTWVKGRTVRWRPVVSSSFSLYRKRSAVLDPMKELSGQATSRPGSRRRPTIRQRREAKRKGGDQGAQAMHGGESAKKDSRNDSDNDDDDDDDD
ncbi:hypothetical protein F5X96DRAFT_375830 [Biscogniauxia mediterranea]|nr:hypothetical protein F5X96DRAFT_375830 [Biscogniauxia mediterranea]